MFVNENTVTVQCLALGRRFFASFRSVTHPCVNWAPLFSLHCGFAFHFVHAHLAFSVTSPSLYPPLAAVGLRSSLVALSEAKQTSSSPALNCHKIRSFLSIMLWKCV